MVFLSSVNFANADLSGAVLDGVFLRLTNLEGTKLVGAWYDKNTDFPIGFDPAKKGMIERVEGGD